MNKVADASNRQCMADGLGRPGTSRARPKSEGLVFKYPLHILDDTGAWITLRAGVRGRILSRTGNGTAKTQEEKDALIQDAFEVVSMGEDEVAVKNWRNISQKTLKK